MSDQFPNALFPQIVERMCLSRMIICNDYLDFITFYCGLPAGHEGDHSVKDKENGFEYTMSWHEDKDVHNQD